MAKLLTENNIPVFKENLASFNQAKIVEAIEKLPKHSWLDSDQKLSNGNYNLAKKDDSYWDLAFPAVRKFLDGVIDKNLPQFNFWNITSQWFQVYEKGDFHNWHIHGNCMFSGVFYISLEESGCLQTADESVGNIDVFTGDIILFPSFLEHRVVEHSKETPRVVIAFNVNFDRV